MISVNLVICMGRDGTWGKRRKSRLGLEKRLKKKKEEEEEGERKEVNGKTQTGHGG